MFNETTKPIKSTLQKYSQIFYMDSIIFMK